MNVAQNIKANRTKLGLTQKQLAEKVNKSEVAIRMWELGKNEPTLSSLLILKNIFEVTLDELVE
ncbi:MAG: helix-turn-helix transcriptional regulator [Solibacillus sp.]|uniref:helix-turn-helix transcriptional regulator n=1 Tax=Solibacillus sp. TaxID=1909654 RepID=UPI0033149F18